MPKDNIFSPDLVITQLHATDRFDAIDKLAARLAARGYVLETHAAAVKEREQEFPTALEIDSVNVAIPHTDTEYCVRPAVAVGILDHEVPWIHMATTDQWIDVGVVFLLSITDPDSQVEWLARLVEFCQDRERMTRLVGLRDPNEVCELLASAVCRS